MKTKPLIGISNAKQGVPHAVFLFSRRLFLLFAFLAVLTAAGLLGLDRVTAVATISLITMPAYVAGLLLLLVFSVHWQIMPATGTGSLSNPADYARHLALPALALAVTWIGYLARLVRTSMLEVLNERYILAARSQGIRDRLVVYKYALRNAVIPTIAVVGVG